MFKKIRKEKIKETIMGWFDWFVYGLVNWKQLSIDVDNKVILFYKIIIKKTTEKNSQV